MGQAQYSPLRYCIRTLQRYLKVSQVREQRSKLPQRADKKVAKLSLSQEFLDYLGRILESISYSFSNAQDQSPRRFVTEPLNLRTSYRYDPAGLV